MVKRAVWLPAMVIVVGCAGHSGSGTGRIGTVLGTWRSSEDLPADRTITFRSDGTYTYKNGSFIKESTYTVSGTTLTLQDNVITTPNTYKVSFPDFNLMDWEIDYADFKSHMSWYGINE